LLVQYAFKSLPLKHSLVCLSDGEALLDYGLQGIKFLVGVGKTDFLYIFKAESIGG